MRCETNLVSEVLHAVINGNFLTSFGHLNMTNKIESKISQLGDLNMLTDTRIKEDELKKNIAAILNDNTQFSELMNAMSRLGLLKIRIGNSNEYIMLNASEIIATNQGVIIQTGDKVAETNVDDVIPTISKWLDFWRLRKSTPVSEKFNELDSGYIYEPKPVRVLNDANAKDGTRVVGTMCFDTFGSDGNLGISLMANQAALLFLGEKRPSSTSLIEVPIYGLTCYCENGLVDFEANQNYIIEHHKVEILFPTVQTADEFAHLALIEGGSNFLLRTKSGRSIEILFLEVEHG